MSEIIEGKWDKKVLDVSTSWKGLENYIEPILIKYNAKRKLALEFGVDYGYSLYVLSQIFDKVIGVDGFVGDEHCGRSQGDDFYRDTLERFKNSPNVEIKRALYEDYTPTDNNFYDFIHVDIVHLYKQTYECTDWCVQHSNLVVLHDIYSFPDMNKVCVDISKKYNLEYNSSITKYHGLGILYRPS